MGFIGLCAKLASGWTCSSHFETVANKVSEAAMNTGTNATGSYDPLGLLNIGKSFRDEVVFDGLLSVPAPLSRAPKYCFGCLLTKLILL